MTLKLVSVRPMPHDTKRRLWSDGRPTKPESDPIIPSLGELLRSDNRSNYAKANVSGLAPSTLSNIVKNRTRRPQHLTVAMIYQMYGYELRPVLMSSPKDIGKRRL